MGKFEGKSGSGKRSKSNYKSKRSFTKNKGFREDNKKRPERSYGSNREFRSDDRPYHGKVQSDDKKRFREEEDRPKKKWDNERSYSDRKNTSREKGDKPKRKWDNERSYSDRKNTSKEEGERPKRKWDSERGYSDRKNTSKEEGDRPKKKWDNERSYSDRKNISKEEGDKPKRKWDKEGKSFKTKEDKFSGFKKATEKGGFRREDDEKPQKKKRFSKPRKFNDDSERRVKHEDFEQGKVFSKPSYKEEFRNRKESKTPTPGKTSPDGLIRLNKYLSNAGVASRREADNLISSGTVKVNGVVVNQLGTKIKPTDTVTFGDSAVRTERKVYLLLNKPKDYITTMDDPKERKTVMELIEGACRERVYPVGRLDRNTTGLLLFTNDGDLTKKLTHPKHGIKKVYHVSLNKGLKAEDFKSIVEGVELEDGPAQADDLAFVGEGKKEVGIEIHSGRNRIVRRIFEHLGYDVLKLDRVVFAGLTKKDLPRGKHRFLTPKEVSFLQMIG